MEEGCAEVHPIRDGYVLPHPEFLRHTLAQIRLLCTAINQKVIVPLTSTERRYVLIIDDFLFSHNHSKKAALLSHIYDHISDVREVLPHSHARRERRERLPVAQPLPCILPGDTPYAEAWPLVEHG